MGSNRARTTIAALFCALAAQGAGATNAVPGAWSCSIIGNTFPGFGPNGEGAWVQNGADEIEVAPDGTVITAGLWDEAGRCTAFYRDGRCNSHILRCPEGTPQAQKCWGWGTCGQAVAVDGDLLYVGTAKADLLRFRWSPGGDPNRFELLDVTPTGEFVGLSARAGTVAGLAKDGTVTLRDGAAPATVRATWQAPGATDLAFAPDGTLWLLVGTEVRHRAPDGREMPGVITDAGQPFALAFAHDGRLLVCDAGPRQQVLFYSVTNGVRLVQRFGVEGGVRAAGGAYAADRLFAPRGAGTDAQGNLYVHCGWEGGPMGRTVLRSWAPDGTPRWELMGLFFTDTADFCRDTDGAEILGLDTLLRLDYTDPERASWTLTGLTVDPLAQPRDPRLADGKRQGVLARTLVGRRLLFATSMYAGGYDVYLFPTNSLLAAPVAVFDKAQANAGSWAWWVDLNGDVWEGDRPGERVIRRYAFEGFGPDGLPSWNRDKPDVFAWPADITELCRLVYDEASDTLYIGHATAEQRTASWGTSGTKLSRWDGWRKGERRLRWSVDQPLDDEKLQPKCFAVASDFVFFAPVKAFGGVNGNVVVHRAADGGRVGIMRPPDGMTCGWVDMALGINAMRRKDGEYLVLLEEDFRAKNLLYRWRPPAGAEESSIEERLEAP